MALQEPTIDDLIEQLRSEAGKVRVTELALKRGLKVNTKYVDRAREFYTKAGDPEIALSYAMNFEQAERILASYDPKKRKKIELVIQESHPEDKFLREFFSGIDWHDIESSIRTRAYVAIERGEAAAISGNANPLPFYKEAVVRFLTLMDFIAAYEFAVRKRFPTGKKLSPEQFSLKYLFKSKPTQLTTKNRIYAVGITFYEAFEEFAKAAQLEALRGDAQRFQLYQTIDKILKAT